MSRRNERIDHIANTALAIVRRDGLEALTMAGLARETGYSHARAYYYFKTREALLTELQLRGIARLDALLDARLDGVDDPLERVRLAATTWSAFRRAEPDHHRVIDQSLSDPRHILDDVQRSAVHEALAGVLAKVTATLEAAPLSSGDAHLRTQALWAAVHGAGHFEKRGLADTLESELVETLLAGWS